MLDKYKAVWLSHSSLNDFLTCERLYYLKNVFKDPSTRRKINIVSPYLTLGIVVHKVIENLKNIKSLDREEAIKKDLLKHFQTEWSKYHLHKGGFKNQEEEDFFFKRGEEMIQKVVTNPGHLLKKIIPLKHFYEGDIIPNYYISEEDNLILCGSVDWIEYLEKEDALRIIDFKTGRNDESDESFQLPIYYLLLTTLQKENRRTKIYPVKEMAYWYLDFENKKKGTEHSEFQVIKIDKEKIQKILEVKNKIIEIGRKIKNFRENKIYKCNNEENINEGCRHCQDFEKIYKFIQNRELEKIENTVTIEGSLDTVEKLEYLGVSDYNQDMYYLN